MTGTVLETSFSQQFASLVEHRRRCQCSEAKEILTSFTSQQCSLPEVILEKLHLDLIERSPANNTLKSLRNQLKFAEISPAQQCSFLTIEAVCRNRLGEFNKSIAAFRQAWRLAEQSDSATQKIDLLIEQGTAFTWQGRFESALSVYFKALYLSQNEHDAIGQALILAATGRFHLEKLDYENAKTYCQTALNTIEKWENSREILRLTKDLAEIYLGNGDYISCLNLIRPFLSSENTSLDTYLRFTFTGLCLCALNRKGELDEIEVLINSLNELCREGDDWQLAQKNLVLGECYLQQQPQLSLELLTQALAIFDSNGLAVPAWRCHMLMVQVNHFLNNTSAAALSLRYAKSIATDNNYLKLLEECDKLQLVLQLPHALSEEHKPLSKNIKDASEGYVLLNKIGSGTFGNVYEAFDSLRDKTVAIKQFSFNDIYDVRQRETIIDNIRNELIACQSLDHPALIKIDGFGLTPDKVPYTVMPLIEGVSLRHQINHQPLTLGQIKAIFSQVCHGLAHAHDKSILHRDLKPENILVLSDNRAMVVDFGLACLTHLKQDKAIGIGTLGYMSPEQQQGDEGNAKMDVFAIGVILFEAITGERPWANCAPFNRLSYFLQLRQVKKHFKQFNTSPQVFEIVMQCLAFSPSNRPSMEKITEVLDAI